MERGGLALVDGTRALRLVGGLLELGKGGEELLCERILAERLQGVAA